MSSFLDMSPRFNSDFLWGASTSAYQVEGGWDADGKGPSVIDMRDSIPEGTADFTVAADHYHRFEEDVQLFAELGLKAYRFSIAWTRIVPDGDGEINEQGLAHYDKLIDALVRAGITPVATLFHFDLPHALNLKGGWASRSTIDAFERYARIVIERFSDRVPYWLTINEQNMMVMMGDVLGTSDDGAMARAYQENHHMFLAQARVMKACHEIAPNVKIGPAPNIACVYPETPHPLDVQAAEYYSALRNWLYLDMATRGTYHSTAWGIMERKGWLPEVQPGDGEILANANPDFIALNYYVSHTVRRPLAEDGEMEGAGDQHIVIGEPGVYKGVPNSTLPTNDFGWEVDPVGFRTTLRQVWERYNLPILVTENGLGAFDVVDEDGRVRDPYRIDYLAQHIEQIGLAISEGVQMIGYCPWSAIDLVSTHQGIKKRYGFIYVDRTEDDLRSLNRLKKDSFYWYQRVIDTNGADLSSLIES
ncbi:MAG: glycoside hydrolase family 1 protein [Flaviflexus sp.]|uniref:glycoside hydrolase family 1 protein n=1 Tax=Flaviflexus sp. TaxID=1969482 RepID=UPI00352C7756